MMISQLIECIDNNIEAGCRLTGVACPAALENAKAYLESIAGAENMEIDGQDNVKDFSIEKHLPELANFFCSEFELADHKTNDAGIALTAKVFMQLLGILFPILQPLAAISSIPAILLFYFCEFQNENIWSKCDHSWIKEHVLKGFLEIGNKNHYPLVALAQACIILIDNGFTPEKHSVEFANLKKAKNSRELAELYTKYNRDDFAPFRLTTAIMLTMTHSHS